MATKKGVELRHENEYASQTRWWPHDSDGKAITSDHIQYCGCQWVYKPPGWPPTLKVDNLSHMFVIKLAYGHCTAGHISP